MYPTCQLRRSTLRRAIKVMHAGGGAKLTAAEIQALQDWQPAPWRAERSAQEIIDTNTARNARMRALLKLAGHDDAWALVGPEELLEVLRAIESGATRMRIDIEEYIERFGEWPERVRDPLGNLWGTSGDEAA